MTTVRLTPEIERKILLWVRNGAYPHEAALSEGVSLEHFSHWLALGRRRSPRAPRRYRRFVRAIETAAGQARAWAEIKVREKDPKFWLLSGPGRERDGNQGWTSAVRPVPLAASDQDERDMLMNPQVTRALGIVLAELVEFPEKRQKVARKLAGEPGIETGEPGA